MIGGTTAYDNNTAALDSILTTWNNSRATFPARVSSLSGQINSSTVFDDGARDRLDGGANRDWYLDYLLTDTLVGFNPQQDKKN